jgi:hypothetical protein
MSRKAAPRGGGVRLLCERPSFIKPVLEEPRSPHPIGLGIKNNYVYRLENEALRLPKSREGHADILRVTGEPIELLDETYRQQAWRAILVAPKLLEKLPDPLSAAHSYGIDLRPSRRHTLHALALGTVVLPPRALQTEQGTVNEVPVAGVGCLFLLADAKATDRAWLRVRWTTSTRSLSREIESLHLYHGLKLQYRRRRALLLARGEDRGDLGKRLVACGAALGFDLTVLRDAEIVAEAAESVKQSPPAVTIAGGTALVPPEVLERVKSLGRDVFTIPDENPELFLEELRERLTVAAFLTPALRCRLIPKDEMPDDQRFVAKAKLPIVERGQRFKHQITGFLYEEDVTSGLYYTQDRSNHSSMREDDPVAYKRYRATAGALVWDADLDKNGVEIGEDVKHKGPKYKTIPWKDLIPS